MSAGHLPVRSHPLLQRRGSRFGIRGNNLDALACFLFFFADFKACCFCVRVRQPGLSLEEFNMLTPVGVMPAFNTQTPSIVQTKRQTFTCKLAFSSLWIWIRRGSLARTLFFLLFWFVVVVFFLNKVARLDCCASEAFFFSFLDHNKRIFDNKLAASTPGLTLAHLASR